MRLTAIKTCSRLLSARCCIDRSDIVSRFRPHRDLIREVRGERQGAGQEEPRPHADALQERVRRVRLDGHEPGGDGQEAHARQRRQVRHRLLRIPAACRWFAQCANTPEAKARASERRFEGAWREPRGPLRAASPLLCNLPFEARLLRRISSSSSRRSARTRRWRCLNAPRKASRRTTSSSRSSPRCNQSRHESHRGGGISPSPRCF